MQKSIFLFLAVFYFSVTLKAQDPEKYNAVYNKVYVEISQMDFNRALEIADSLYNISETDLFKAKSLMLSASLYEQAGDLKKAIDYAKRADKTLEKSNDYVWKTRILGFLASQHRSLSLYNESEKFVNRAIETAKKIDDPKRADVTLGLLEQEKAMGKSESGNFREAIIHFDKAAEYFEESVTDTLLIAQNHQFKGQAFLGLDEYEKAITEFQKVLDLWGDMPDNYIKGMSYVGMAQAYSKTNRLELAKENLDLAEKTLKGSEYLEVRKAFWDAKVEYYQAANEVNLLKTAYSKRDSITNEIKKQKDSFLDYSFSELSQENLKNSKNQKLKNYALVGGSLVLLAGLAFIILYRNKKKKEIQRFKQYIEELKKSEAEKIAKQTKRHSENQADDNIMSAESEEKILSYLEKFEESKLYTKSDVSLSWLAAYCKTNNKYLSFCINKHKGKDFNNYINELRIEYVILKLINNPVYKKYKIATLAEEAGFSSQNKFSMIFKSVTSITPSAFIKQLDGQEKTD